MIEHIDITGKRFGRLVALEYIGKSRWLCQCDCGNKKVIRTDHLKNGATISCGCYNREASSKRNRKHGMTASPEYYAWAHMIKRCENPTDSRFYRYGARGITVCARWKGQNGFQNFINDMGRRPGPKYSIDRINNDGNYEPSNCKWSTMLEQTNNRGNNRLISYLGETRTLKEWSRELGFDYKNIWERMNCGWDFEKAIKMEKRETVRHLVEYKGVTKTITQWCKELHLEYGTVQARLKRGWEVSRAFEEPIDVRFRKR